MTLDYFATAPRGAEDLLAAELRALGVKQLSARHGGVAFTGTLREAYAACLWSRVASRVLAQVASLDASSADTLYAGARALPWADHLRQGSSFAIAASGHAAPESGIDNSHFAALRVKDALVDCLRERWGARPDVDRDAPDLRLRLHLSGQRAVLSVDLSGEGLHRRGYRQPGAEAPLRENLAAAVLLRAGWATFLAEARASQSLLPTCLDPLCGSGTLLIEAAWLAADIAPGLLRERWGFFGWAQHQRELWSELVSEARERAETGRGSVQPRLLGFDSDQRAVRTAIACVEAAGLRGVVHIERRELSELVAPGAATGPAAATPASPPGLLVCNPPWGERLEAGSRRKLEALYATLGARAREAFPAWECCVLAGDPSLGHSLGLRAHHRNALHDGPIACQILRIRVSSEAQPHSGQPRERSEGGRAFANRLRKNAKALRSWLRREEISCYRLYDADIPDFNLAIDLYHEEDDGLRHAHVQEYAPPKTIDEVGARRRRREALAIIREDLELPRERVHFKRRERQRGRAQYTRLEGESEGFVVREGPARLWVDLERYLDTGLFLDHRPTRARIAELARDAELLNLFCYTASATVHAVLGGARSSTSVDLSRSYLEWGARNMGLNGLRCVGPEPGSGRGPHELVRADVLAWLRQAGTRRWDLIFCDPPSFSNSKRMDEIWDVQRDHAGLIRRCVGLLKPGGTLVFSTNLRSFRLDEEALADLELRRVPESLPRDFSRTPKIHQVFDISRR